MLETSMQQDSCIQNTQNELFKLNKFKHDVMVVAQSTTGSSSMHRRVVYTDQQLP